MPIFQVKAQRLINHFAIVSAKDKEEATAKYIAEEWAWDEVVSHDLLKGSIDIEEDLRNTTTDISAETIGETIV